MTDLVIINQGKPCTTSRKIAVRFRKEHRNVLQSIKNLECSAEFTALNFQLSEFKDPTGRSLPEYYMTRDGFSFLIMGFTGREAAKFKEEFIEAFNKMEKELAKRAFDPDSLSRVDILQMALESEKARLALEKENKTLRPKAEIADKLMKIDTVVSISQAAKLLALGFGNKTLYRELRQRRIFFKHKNEPRQEFVNNGWFVLKEVFLKFGEIEKLHVQPYVTQKGLEGISRIFSTGSLFKN